MKGEFQRIARRDKKAFQYFFLQRNRGKQKNERN